MPFEVRNRRRAVRVRSKHVARLAVTGAQRRAEASEAVISGRRSSRGDEGAPDGSRTAHADEGRAAPRTRTQARTGTDRPTDRQADGRGPAPASTPRGDVRSLPAPSEARAAAGWCVSEWKQLAAREMRTLDGMKTPMLFGLGWSPRRPIQPNRPTCGAALRYQTLFSVASVHNE